MNTQNTQLFNQTTNQIKEELYYEYFDNEIFEKMTDDIYEIQYLEELRYEMLKRNYYGEMMFNCDEYEDKQLKKLHKLALSIDVFNDKNENINERCILKYFNIYDYFKSKITTNNKIKMNEELENEILKKLMIERNEEINNIRCNLTHYNYFVRVFKKHYGQKHIYNASFPLVLYDYINEIDKCLKNKMKNTPKGV